MAPHSHGHSMNPDKDSSEHDRSSLPVDDETAKAAAYPITVATDEQGGEQQLTDLEHVMVDALTMSSRFQSCVFGATRVGGSDLERLLRSDYLEGVASDDLLKKMGADDEEFAGGGVGYDEGIFGQMRPSIFREAIGAVDHSLIIYCLAELRVLARAGKLRQHELVLEPPISIYTILELVNANINEIAKSMGLVNYGIFMESVHGMEKRLAEDSWRLTKAGVEGQYKNDGCVVFGDDNYHEELVYMIEVARLHKVIVVTFRGSVTATDFRADVKFAMKTVPNPLSHIEGQAEFMRVHSGFYEYLHYKVADPTSIGQDGEKVRQRQQQQKMITKCQKILQELSEILKDHPGYTLYVTGHSLGGALALLFAFEAAASKDLQIPKPISCFTIAAPKVGNISFRRAFEHLEEHKLIRALRVTNNGDVVNLVPALGLLGIGQALFFPDKIFRHVGVKLKLWQRHYKYEISHSTQKTGLRLLLHDLNNCLRQALFSFLFCPYIVMYALRLHNCFEYSMRLRKNFSNLMDVFLDDILHEVYNEGKRGVLYRGQVN